MILGIDPGLDGALSFLEGDALVIVDMPTLKAGVGGKRIVDENELSTIIDVQSAKIRHVFVEAVSAMPKQGVTSVFSFGTSYGLVRGILAAHFLQRTFIRPQVWKKALQVPAAKDGAIARASQLMPEHRALWPLKKHDGRAESALIALYGSRQFERNAT